MDNRPNTSIWGTILSYVEIALNVYQVVAIKGKGMMVKSDKADDLLGKALFQGKAKDGYVHFEKGSLGEQAAAYELIKNGHITDPKVIEQYGTSIEIEVDDSFLNPEYFDGLPEPKETPWGTPNTKTPIDNGVFFMSTDSRSGIAVHKTISEFCMSDYARDKKYGSQYGDYYFYDLNKGAAIAIFELSASLPKVLDLITSWESLMHTLVIEFPHYTDNWNHITGQDTMIYDVPAPPFMFLQHHLDEIAKQPLMETNTKGQEADNFFEQAQAYIQEAQAKQKDLDMPYVNAYCNGEMARLVPTAQNIAAYIMINGLQGDITMTTPLDKHFLSTFGTFINQCSDFDFMENKLKPVLIPMQTGDVEPPSVEEYPDIDELGNYEDEWDGDVEP